MRNIKLRMFIPGNTTAEGIMVYRGIYDKNWYLNPTKCEHYRAIKQIDCSFALMLSTGLKDKNETDIYEGDIVQTKVRNETLEIGEVAWHDDEIVGYRTIYYKNGLKYTSYLCGWYEYEILGNKFQNPELLEEKK